MSALIPSLEDTSGDLMRRVIDLLQSIMEHLEELNRMRPYHSWEMEYYPISCGADCIRPGRPDACSDEVRLLIQLGIVHYHRHSHNPDIPEDSLRIPFTQRTYVDGVIKKYLAHVRSV